MTPEEFFAEALPWAQQAHPPTNVLVSVILAQWADETGFGGPDWKPNNNPGNVGSYDNKPVATFPTMQAGVNAYIHTMNLPYYTSVRNADTAVSQAVALGQSPWASGHYGIPPGRDLIRIMNQYDLTKYDGPPAGLVEGETMSSIVIGQQLHVFGVIGSTAHHWWQELGTSTWTHEVLPA